MIKQTIATALLLASTATFADGPFNGGAATIGVAVPDSANPGGIISYEIGRDNLLSSWNPYGSFTYVRDSQLTEFGKIDIVGTSVALGLSIPTNTMIKPRVGFNYNVKSFTQGSETSFGLDLGLLVAAGNGIAITSSYNTEIRAYSIGIGYAW